MRNQSFASLEDMPNQTNLAIIVLLDLHQLELLEKDSVVQATQSAVFCYGSPSNPIHQTILAWIFLSFKNNDFCPKS
jgi:hypothetical protein